MPDRSRNPPPPGFVCDAEGEYLAVRTATAAEAVLKAHRELGYEADLLDPVAVRLTPVGGVPGCDVFWTEDLDTLKGEVEPRVELSVLGEPVGYWRLRDGC